MLCISLSTGRSATRFWRKCIYAIAAYVDKSHAIVQPCAWWTRRLCFSWSYNGNVRVTLHGGILQSTAAVFRTRFFGRLHRPVTCVPGVLESWNFLCIVTPSWGADPLNFKKQFDDFFFCLISPTYFPAYNSCSTCTRGLKFVMLIDPPHARPTTTFLFQNSTKIVHFFNFFKKKSVPSRVPTSSPHNFCYNGPRGLKFVMRIHPLTRDRVAYFDLKIRRKLFILSTFSKMFVK